MLVRGGMEEIRIILHFQMIARTLFHNVCVQGEPQCPDIPIELEAGGLQMDGKAVEM